jgi:hypothetical protein
MGSLLGIEQQQTQEKALEGLWTSVAKSYGQRSKQEVNLA